VHLHDGKLLRASTAAHCTFELMQPVEAVVKRRCTCAEQHEAGSGGHLSEEISLSALDCKHVVGGGSSTAQSPAGARINSEV
jgi:hypothetical protein